MEIIKGTLDDISRPASSEQTGSRVSSVSLTYGERIDTTTPFTLVVLNNDATDVQTGSRYEETTISSSSRGPIEDTNEENENPQLQRAFKEMRRLDEILSAKICIEKEVKRQRKEIQAKLWQELMQNNREGHSECAQEAMNTRLFLALEAPTGTEEEDNFVPVFETQVPDCEQSRDSQYLEKSEKTPDSSTDLFEQDLEETGEEQFKGSHCGASKGKKKQKDFVKRNIELVSSEGDRVLLTQAEKERLAELLGEEQEDEEDSARGADSEGDMWAVSVLTGQGYTPEPSDLEQLIDIDFKMRLLLPVEEFASMNSSYTNLTQSFLVQTASEAPGGNPISTSTCERRCLLPLEPVVSVMCQGRGSEVGWKCDGDPQPGEKALQDIKERRGQERRLHKIQQQLEILGQGQDMTNESLDLTEEQILSLLDDCELTDPGS